MKNLNGKPFTDLEGNILTRVMMEDIKRDKALMAQYDGMIVDKYTDIKEEILMKLKEMGGDSTEGGDFE